MLVSEPPKKTHDAINGITSTVACNSLIDVPATQSKMDPGHVEKVLREYFTANATVQQFVALASMDRNRDTLSIAQVLLDTAVSLAMPRPKFADTKITAEEKAAVERSYRDCQRTLQTFTQQLFSYNAKLAQNTPLRNTEVLDCLAGLLIGYLNKEAKPVE